MGQWFGALANRGVLHPWFGGGIEVTKGVDSAAVTGAVAGNVTVVGINTPDDLISVFFLDPNGGGAGVSSIIDLTSEFSITAVDTINNTGGTNTSGGNLLVLWASQDERI